MSVMRPGNERRSAGIIGPLLAGAIAVAALTCGYIGLYGYAAHNGFGRSPTDILYYDLQLFVLSSPPVDGGASFPFLLDIARFTAPLVTVFTLVEAGRRLFAAEIVMRRIRRARAHEIVCGSGSVADALVDRLIRERRWVVRVADGPTGAHGLLGDPTSADIMRAAGVAHAHAVYACTPDSATNLAVAMAAAGVPRRVRTTLDIHVEIDDLEFCLALQARRLGLASSPRLHVNFFNSHELAARTLIRMHGLPAVVDRAARLTVVGVSWFGVALIVELARQWRGRLAESPYPLEIALVAPDAGVAIARLRRRYPFLATICQFTAHEVRIDTLLDGDLTDQAPDRVYLCDEDEEASLKLALTMDQFWHGGPETVVVRLRRLGRLEQAFRDDDERLLDDVSGALYLFDAVRAGSAADLVEDSLVERLGRTVHENYVASQLSAGADPKAATLQPWTELPESTRAANRAQAADIGRKLRSVGCVLAPSPIWGDPVVFDSRAIEQLARMEHERWCDYLRAQGWRHGRNRDENGRLHPDLVEWKAATEAAREKNREAVRQIPVFLSDAGFQIVTVERDARIPIQRSPS